MEESEEGQRLRFLENEIHKTNLKLMEGETIKKKYNSILDMLKKERLTFGNQLEGLENQIKKQDEEIERLKVATLTI
jgi:DNA repair ATPase RecN